jgi:hemerythrin-like domain-containing protein
LLDDLGDEHRRGAEMIRALEQGLARYEQGGDAEFPSFAALVETFAAFHWEHMRKEEREAMPLAEAHLAVEDWDVIDAAFTGHTDPLFGADRDAPWEQLFRRIVHLAPPPIGVGPMR